MVSRTMRILKLKLLTV